MGKRPKNVREFMIEYLESIKHDEEGVFDPELVPTALPALFEEKDIRTMFAQFDVNGRGTVSASRCQEALQAMGVEPSEMSVASVSSYDEESFVALAMDCMSKKTAL